MRSLIVKITYVQLHTVDNTRRCLDNSRLDSSTKHFDVN